MITQDKLPGLLNSLGFTENKNKWTQKYDCGGSIVVDLDKKSINYGPVDNGFKNGDYPTLENQANGFVIHRDTTLNFSAKENFVCLVCIHLLLKKGYEPKHFVIEPAFKVGHVNKQSYGDILVFDKNYKPLVLIENKTFGAEFSTEWNNMQKDGGQLFSYLGPLDSQIGVCENLVLFAADFDENLVLKSHIITLKDNDKRIAELENPKTFKNRDPAFEVWDQTYAKSFETKGLFEDDISAYSIGKLKYTISDLKGLSHAEIKPIYHEFATILRNNAITDFEHSFYILIDLFLCKITDERNNPDDLQFYYKGISRDTPKEYCSRLLKLYKQGKKELFDVDVINKEDSDIEQIFNDTGRSLQNGLFAGIKELFEEIKFYNIKKFNFIDVENKEEFELNFQILIKITALIQDINLSNSDTNHFFGDLFEGLLSKNVHQTEGQFFTPLPIVNFIIKSLPEFKNTKNVKVLDYACGAGHFLTEFVKNYPNTQIYGIEKSQPLSQVAKIATIINGAGDNSHIVFKDALSIINDHEIRFAGFNESSFDCIIANPPYSVKGFLNTLTKADREQFELIKSVDNKTFDKKGCIECFFIERSKHFLKKYGFMGIILPSSILTNGELYKKARELLFEHFDILSIVSLGSRTFGSTGTNTIILFAQRVKKNASGFLDSFLSKKDYTQYLNGNAIDNYLKMQGYNKDDYLAFMQDEKLSEVLENHEIFKDYNKNCKYPAISKTQQKTWFKQSSFFDCKLKENSQEYKELYKKFLSSNEYLNLENSEKKKIFINYARKIEKDKLETFIKIETNNVVILQSPPDKIGNKSNKNEVINFLGYDWSSRKGEEGIKYVVDEKSIQTASDTKGDEDAEEIEAINSIKYIKTPLYNPSENYDSSKYAFALRKHLCEQCKKGKELNISLSEKLKEFYANEIDSRLFYSKLTDMIDFSRATFEKEIRLKKKVVEVKYKEGTNILKASNIFSIIESGSRPKGGVGNIVDGALSIGGEHIDNFNGYLNLSNPKYVPQDFFINAKNGKIKSNDILLCKDGALTGKVALVRDELDNKDAMVNEHVFVLRSSDLNTQLYLYNFLFSIYGQSLLKNNITGSAQGGLNSSNLKEIKIPLPSKEVQERIVSQCQKLDMEAKEAKEKLNQLKEQIENFVKNIHFKKVKIGTLGEIKMCKRILKDDTSIKGEIPFYKIGTFGKEADAFISKKLFDEYKSKYPYPKQGQVLISAAGTIGKVIIFDGKPSYFQDSNIVWIDADENIILNRYLHLCIQFVNWESFETNGGIIKRLYNDNLRNTEIPLPPLKEQNKIVKEVEKMEADILNYQKLIDSVQDEKNEILKKELLA